MFGNTGRIRTSSVVDMSGDVNSDVPYMRGSYAANGNKVKEASFGNIDSRVIGDKFSITVQQKELMLSQDVNPEAVKWLICLMKKDFGEVLYTLPYDSEKMSDSLKRFKSDLNLADIENAINYMKCNRFLKIYNTESGIRTLIPSTRINRILINCVEP